MQPVVELLDPPALANEHRAGTGPAPLDARGVVVSYGRRRVVGPLDLRLESGEVYALLGPNGCGKSSLVRVLLGMQRGAAGETRLLGLDPWRSRVEALRDVGYVPEEPQAPPEMTARQLVSFCLGMRAAGSGESACRGRALARLERARIPLDRAFGKLSRGQKKQVELALAAAHRPRLLVLDDPSLGLDALARRAFFSELMAELAESESTVLLTTHDLAAVEGVATRVGVLSAGRLLLDEPIESLKGRFRRLCVPAGAEDELACLRPLRREPRPWGVEIVVEDWRREASAGHEGQPMTLEEIFAAVLQAEQEGQR